MEIAVIVELKKIFEASANEQNGVEFWLARDLQELLGYSDWRIFLNTIVKSKITCNSVGEEI
jgi:DNA-damage-inducible protein D